MGKVFVAILVVALLTVCIPVMTFALEGSKNDDGLHLYHSYVTDGRVKFSVYIPKKYAGNGTWSLYVDSIDEAGKVAEGKISKNGMVKTIVADISGYDRITAYLVLYHPPKIPYAIKKADFETDKGIIKRTAIQYGSLFVAVFFGFCSSFALTWMQMKRTAALERQKEAERNLRAQANIYRKLWSCARDLLEKWGRVNRSEEMPELLKAGGLELISDSVENIEDIADVMRSLRNIYGVWKRKTATDSDKKDLEEILGMLSEWLGEKQ